MKRIPLTEEQRKRFVHLAWECYNAVAADAWGGRTPSKADFLDVIGQQMFDGAQNARHEMTKTERDQWNAMGERRKREIMLESGGWR